MFNGFKILDLPLVYPLDVKVLEKAYQQKINQSHPDREGSSVEFSATDVNQAYTLLKDPVQRAQHLWTVLDLDPALLKSVCEAILLTSFERREALAQAEDLNVCQTLKTQAHQALTQEINEIVQAFDQKEYSRLPSLISQAKYSQKFIQEVQNKIWHLEETAEEN